MHVSIELPELTETLTGIVRSVIREELGTGQSRSEWLDVDGVAAYASMTPEAVRASIRRRQLRSYRSETGRIRCRVEDVESFLRGASA